MAVGAGRTNSFKLDFMLQPALLSGLMREDVKEQSVSLSLEACVM